MCVDEFTGNTMGQSDLEGRLLFLHSNMHKWDLRLPEKFNMHYQRRWAKMLPGGLCERICRCCHAVGKQGGHDCWAVTSRAAAGERSRAPAAHANI